ncbi:MAG: nuclear transport factor 2 family protein [Solirubrobacterales bacterium]
MQQFLRATTRGDLDAMIALVREDLEFVPITAAMEGRKYVGHDGVRQFMEDLADYWEFFETIQEEWHDLGDRVVALGCWHARGRASGVEINGAPAAWVAYITDGKIARWRTYTDVEEGLAAAGLPKRRVRSTPG